MNFACYSFLIEHIFFSCVDAIVFVVHVNFQQYWFDSHYEFLLLGRVATKEYFVEVLHHLHEIIQRKRSELWANNFQILHYDSLLAHISLLLHKLFWQKTTSSWCHSVHIYQLLTPTTFFCSERYTGNWKYIVQPVEKIKQNCRVSWRLYYTVHFTDVLCIGKHWNKNIMSDRRLLWREHCQHW